jgi:hypothetical protein
MRGDGVVARSAMALDTECSVFSDDALGLGLYDSDGDSSGPDSSLLDMDLGDSAGASEQQPPSTHAGAGACAMLEPCSSAHAARAGADGGAGGVEQSAAASAHGGAGGVEQSAAEQTVAGAQSPSAAASGVSAEQLLQVQLLFPERDEAFCCAVCRVVAGHAGRAPWLVVGKVLDDAQKVRLVSPTHKGLPASFRLCTAKDAELKDIVDCVFSLLFQFQVQHPRACAVHTRNACKCAWRLVLA